MEEEIESNKSHRWRRKAEVDMTSSFESKNELLRAVDSRLSELKEQLADALNKAIDTSCSPKDISELEAEDIRDSLQKVSRIESILIIKRVSKRSSSTMGCKYLK